MLPHCKYVCCIFLQYCPAGSVTDLAKAVKERAERFSEDLIAYILREVVAGLCYLHSSCVLHRDVKGQNVLLTRTARVKLIDFGMSRGIFHGKLCTATLLVAAKRFAGLLITTLL